MRIKMVSLEDGTISCGFRKIAAFTARINPDTESYYITTKRYASLRNVLFGSHGIGVVDADAIDEIAQGLKDADLIGFSSMTGYADITRRVIHRVRELRPDVLMVWGGIHPIIEPENAITADVDAICTGEGEFAFEQFLSLAKEGRDYTKVENFWFKRGEDVIRNGFLPLMTTAQMESLPFPQYGEKEKIYREGKGFEPMAFADYVDRMSLPLLVLWKHQIHRKRPKLHKNPTP